MVENKIYVYDKFQNLVVVTPECKTVKLAFISALISLREITGKRIMSFQMFEMAVDSETPNCGYYFMTSNVFKKLERGFHDERCEACGDVVHGDGDDFYCCNEECKDQGKVVDLLDSDNED